MTATPAENRVYAPMALRWVITSLLFFFGAIILCGEALATSALPPRAAIWGGLALACYAMGMLFLTGAWTGNGPGLSGWKFGPWMLIWYALAFGLATVTWGRPQVSTAAQIAVPNILRALWLVTVGLTCWAIGYAIGPGQPLRKVVTRGVAALGDRFSPEVRNRLIPWLLYAIGATARISSTATTGRFGYVGDAASAVSTATGYAQFLSALSLFAPLGVCAASLQAFRERIPGARLTLAVLFLAELAFGAAAGGKQDFIIAVLAVVIPMSAARRRLPKVALLCCALIFLAIVIPFNQAYRSAARNDSVTLSPSQAVASAPEILQQTLMGQNVLTVLPHSVIYLMQRTREIDSPAVILQRTPRQIPYSSAGQLVAAPIADMVPRAIWPGKPILASGYQFSQEYYGLPSSVYTSTAITPVGDLYRHGGWIPVIVGMMLLGCGVRLLDYVLHVRENPQAVFLVLLLFPSVVSGEQDWVTFLASIPTTVLVWAAATALAFRPRVAR